MRVFASALYFDQLVATLGPQKNLKERAEHRTFAMFLLALWHAEQPAAPSELVQVRAAARAALAAARGTHGGAAAAQRCGHAAADCGVSVDMCTPAQHRAKAEKRKRNEVEWLSPTGDKKQLCPYTGIARARPAARSRPACTVADAAAPCRRHECGAQPAAGAGFHGG